MNTAGTSLLQIISPAKLHFQLHLGLVKVLPGGLEPLLHVGHFLSELPAALVPVQLQKEVVPLL